MFVEYLVCASHWRFNKEQEKALCSNGKQVNYKCWGMELHWSPLWEGVCGMEVEMRRVSYDWRAPLVFIGWRPEKLGKPLSQGVVHSKCSVRNLGRPRMKKSWKPKTSLLIEKFLRSTHKRSLTWVLRGLMSCFFLFFRFCSASLFFWSLSFYIAIVLLSGGLCS